MNKLMTGVLCAGLTIASLTGCSGSSDTASPSSSPSASAAAPEASTPAETPAVSPSSSAPEAAGGIDQSTPEAAMTSYLNALAAGKTEDVCALTAFGDKRFQDVPNGLEQCKKGLSGFSDALKPLADLLDGLRIEGATVKGDKATFTKAKTTPELASTLIQTLKAVKIDGKWYVTTS